MELNIIPSIRVGMLNRASTAQRGAGPPTRMPFIGLQSPIRHAPLAELLQPPDE